MRGSTRFATYSMASGRRIMLEVDAVREAHADVGHAIRVLETTPLVCGCAVGAVTLECGLFGNGIARGRSSTGRACSGHQRATGLMIICTVPRTRA